MASGTRINYVAVTKLLGLVVWAAAAAGWTIPYGYTQSVNVDPYGIIGCQCDIQSVSDPMTLGFI